MEIDSNLLNRYCAALASVVAGIVSPSSLTITTHFQKLSLFITFSEVLGVLADNEQNPIFTDIRGRKADRRLTMARFEKFNEMLFESYCKKSVSNAINKEKERKVAKGKSELSLSALTDAPIGHNHGEGPESNKPLF